MDNKNQNLGQNFHQDNDNNLSDNKSNAQDSIKEEDSSFDRSKITNSGLKSDLGQEVVGFEDYRTKDGVTTGHKSFESIQIDHSNDLELDLEKGIVENVKANTKNNAEENNGENFLENAEDRVEELNSNHTRRKFPNGVSNSVSKTVSNLVSPAIVKQSLQENLSRIEFKFRKLLKNSLPINFQNFRQPKLVFASIKNSAYSLKVFLLLSLVGLLVSSSFFGFSIYLLATIEAPASGGTMREAVLGETFQKFNPVLNPNSNGEEKIVELLYHPLYRVSYPDYAKLGSTYNTASSSVKSSNNSSNSEESSVNNEQNSSEISGDKFANRPLIEPILLAQSPRWVNGDDPNQNFKVVSFELKSDLRWSDKSKLTTKDVAYTFERLKEENGNRQFKNLIENYQLIAISDVKFEIRPIAGKNVAPNPQLIYSLNFTPISADYYENLTTTELANDLRSTTPEVTSGFFSMPIKVEDPDSPRKQVVDNPIRRGGAGGGRAFASAVLEKNQNPNKNLPQVMLDRYILTSYTSVEDGGGEETTSIQKSVREKKVDLFSRVGNLDGQIGGEQILGATGLSEVVLPTNTYYQMFFNTKVNNFFINKVLRKYVFCQMQNYVLPTRWQGQLSQIEDKKALLPLQFGTELEVDCAGSKQELLDFKGSAGTKPYTIKEDTKNNIVQVRLNGNPIKVSLVALEGTEGLARNFQAYLTSTGIETNLEMVQSGAGFDKVLTSGQYNLIFLPITMVNTDPYTIYGTGGQNFNKISQNNRVGEESRRFGVGVEEDLKTYSQTDLPNGELRDKLISFFGQEFVSINLLQVNQEVYLADEIRNLLPSFGLQSKFEQGKLTTGQIVQSATFAIDLYKNLPVWYIDTKRQFRFGS